MKRFFVMLVFAACKRDESTTTAPTETTTSTMTASATAAATTPTTTSSVTVLRTPLPRAKDVLPAGEVSGDSLVVTGDGYRFQIPPGLAGNDRPFGVVYSGTYAGMISDAKLSVWVTKEAFKSDTKALVVRETTAAKAASAKVDPAEPSFITTAGVADTSHAQRFIAHFPDRIELRVMTVNAGNAFILHCETPEAPNAWINVGSTCMTRGVTLHVAPPPGK